MRAPVLLLAALLTLTGCGKDTPKAVPPGPVALVAGKGDQALAAGTYLAPQDFVPPFTFTVPPGWSSTHRGDDAFDLSRPDPAKDAPLVVLALLTPKDDTVATALATAHAAMRGTVTAATGTLLGRPATGFEEVGGTGQLVASPSGTLALDSVPSGHVLVLGTDVDEVPLLAVVLVPDGTQWATQAAAARSVLASMTAG